MTRTVQHSREFDRIFGLARRSQVDPQDVPLAVELTSALRRPGGTQTLRPIQARSLFEIWRYGGLLAPIGVGRGKTLISFFAASVLNAKRPMLFLPASLIEKTKRDMRNLQMHWLIPSHFTIFSYELLSHKQRVNLLDAHNPDLIVADECDALRSTKSACTKRFGRYFESHPECRFVALSGTMTDSSIREYWHLAKWALKAQAMPLPNEFGEMLSWANALDSNPMGGEQARPLPGVLTAFAKDPHKAVYDLGELRRGYRDRLLETPGVVSSTDGAEVLGTSLRIQPLYYRPPSAIQVAQAELRLTWERPDGIQLQDAARMRGAARELALGFYYRWDPEPPISWLRPRQNWARACREIINSNHSRIDTEAQVIDAVNSNKYPHAVQLFRDWKNVESSFIPNPVPVWISEDPIDRIKRWLFTRPAGIVWTRHVAFAEKLASATGVLYYGEEGRTSDGRYYVGDHPHDTPFIASQGSLKRGLNLQAWTRCLYTCLPSNATAVEQTIGRIHRPGSTASVVVVEILVSCEEHVMAHEKAVARAEYVFASTGQEQKILYGDNTMPRLTDNWQSEIA